MVRQARRVKNEYYTPDIVYRSSRPYLIRARRRRRVYAAMRKAYQAAQERYNYSRALLAEISGQTRAMALYFRALTESRPVYPIDPDRDRYDAIVISDDDE